MPSDAENLVFGDIVLVPFPFTDQPATKRRPATVISAQSYNETSPDIILMPITSQLRINARARDVQVEDWQAAGLLKPSAVKPLIATFERHLVLRRLGTLSHADVEGLRAMLATIIG